MFLKEAIPKPYSRIISLVPSQTELLYDLGLTHEVVGITRFCVHPAEWHQHKMRIGGPKALHLDKIKALRPDLIIANKEENIKTEVEELAKETDVWLVDIHNLDDALQMIEDIGILVGKEEAARVLKLQIESGFQELRLLMPAEKKIRVAYFIWKNPWMVCGSDTFIHEMLAWCGWENCFEDIPRYPKIALEELKERNCDRILLSSEPFPFKEKHAEEMKKQFPDLDIQLVDGEMFSWYGSRLMKSIAYFRNMISS